MYARSNTVLTDPSRVDDGIALVRDETMPMLEQIDGFVGASLLVDRTSGRCIVTTAWESREAMAASASRVAPLRQRAAEVFGATPEVAEWEVAVLHRVRRAGHGAATRVIWGHRDPASIDRALDTLTTAVVPRLEDIPGFCSVSTLVDRATGRMVTAVTYESREALEAARERGAALRDEFTRESGGQITEVAEFELAFAHLRVPATV